MDRPELPPLDIVDHPGKVRSYATGKLPWPERNESRPMYFLRSELTFSEGEGLAFILQERERPLFCRNVNGLRPLANRQRGDDPWRPRPINAHFEVTERHNVPPLTPNRLHLPLQGAICIQRSPGTGGCSHCEGFWRCSLASWRHFGRAWFGCSWWPASRRMPSSTASSRSSPPFGDS